MRQIDNFINNLFQNSDDFLVNIYENSDRFVVVCFLPGLKKESINVTYQDDILSIYLNTSTSNLYESYKKLRIEQREFKKMRSFNLPKIKLKDSKATFKDAILTLDLPKENLEEESFRIVLD